MSKRAATVVDEVLENAKKDNSDETREEVARRAEQTINGPVTFAIDGAQFSIPEEMGRESYRLQALEMDVYRKWKNIEEGLSERFNAPECYNTLTAMEYRAIFRFLEITSPVYLDAFNTVQKLTRKRGDKLPPLTTQEGYQLDGAVGRLKDAKRAVKRAHETLAKHYERRISLQAGGDIETRTRQRTSPRGLIDKTVSSLQRMLESSKTPDADKKVANRGLQALRWALSYSDEFDLAYLAHVNAISLRGKKVDATASAAVVK